MNQSRGKIYVCKKDDQTNWEEICIGFIQVITQEGIAYMRGIMQKSTQPAPQLIQYQNLNLQNEDWCLNLRVQPEINYERHGQNIIQWEEKELDIDIAISFIDERYAGDFLQSLMNTRKHFRYEEFDALNILVPSHQNLEAVQGLISDNAEMVIHKISGDDTFLDGIKKVFDEAEQQNHNSILESLYYIARSLIYLKNERVLQCLLSDKYYMTLFGIMEYHSENRGPQRVSYRDFLTKQTKYHQVSELDAKITEKIHFNYRLSYLKESVMAYYLYMEDPTYILFNDIINRNNQYILEGLLLENQTQFIEFLEHFDENLEINSKFTNELILNFRTMLQSKYINEAFVQCMIISKVLKKMYQKLLEKQEPSVVQATLNLSIVANNSNYFQDFIKENSQLFWQNMENLLFSQLVNTHVPIIDLILSIYMNQNLKSQVIDWLKKCLSRILTSSAVNTIQQIVQSIFGFPETITQEMITLSNSILNLMKSRDKFLLMAVLKHFKYLSSMDKSLYLISPYLEEFLLLSVKRNIIDGILEGQVREIIKTLKPSIGISQQLVILIRKHKLENNQLYISFVKEYSYVKDTEQQEKQLMYLEEQQYFENDDSEDNCQQHLNNTQLDGEEVKLSIGRLIRKRIGEDDDDDEEQISYTKKKARIVFGDNLFKKVKQNEED